MDAGGRWVGLGGTGESGEGGGCGGKGGGGDGYSEEVLGDIER